MKIFLIPGSGYNCIHYPRGGLDYDTPISIEIDNLKYCWEMSFCHELAHAILSAQRPKINLGICRFRWELLAWRLAKTFCKPKYWNEQEAIRKLLTYGMDINNMSFSPCEEFIFDFDKFREKFKIIPLQ